MTNHCSKVVTTQQTAAWFRLPGRESPHIDSKTRYSPDQYLVKQIRRRGENKGYFQRSQELWKGGGGGIERFGRARDA